MYTHATPLSIDRWVRLPHLPTINKKKMKENFIDREHIRTSLIYALPTKVVILDSEWETIINNVQSILASQRKELLDEVKDLIIRECNVARSEGEKTSRLTSLWNKIK